MNLQRIKETCLYIKNLDKTEAFYHNTLKLPVISRVEDRHIFFRAGESVLLCFIPSATKKGDKLPAHYANGKIHIAFEIKESEYHIWKNYLISNNIDILHEHNWKNDLKSFYFEDPDGHLLEIICEGIWD